MDKSWRQQPPKLPDLLLNGNVFDRYDDETNTLDLGCNVRFDEYGFFMVWEPKGKDASLLDLTQMWEARPSGTIKDTRVLFDLEQRGLSKDSVESRTVWITYGQDLVVVNSVFLVAKNAQIAKEWRVAVNEFIRTYKFRHACPMHCLQKYWRSILLATNERGRIPIRNIVKTFASGKPERMGNMTLKCLTDLGLAGDKFCTVKRVVSKSKSTGWTRKMTSFYKCSTGRSRKKKEREDLEVQLFTFEKFLRLYHKICPRTDVQELFVKLSGQKEYLTKNGLINFLNEEQRDPRLNEILFPFFDNERVQQLIARYESDESYIAQGKMSGDGFLRFLMSEDNSPVFLDRTELHQDMDQPLCHYYINSSHNTYLIGRQYGGKSSTEIYRQVLLSGCKCIELDCWDGTGENKGEPIITHGKAMCTDVFFKDVLVQIRETAFLRTDYPVILSFENHCSKSNQLKMAKYCMDILGDMLLSKPLDDHPLEAGVPLPSPNRLKRKILIKNKRLKADLEKHQMEQFLREGKLDEEDELEVAHETPEVVGEDRVSPHYSDEPDGPLHSSHWSSHHPTTNLLETDDEEGREENSFSSSERHNMTPPYRLTPSSSARGLPFSGSRNSSPRNSIASTDSNSRPFLLSAFAGGSERKSAQKSQHLMLHAPSQSPSISGLNAIANALGIDYNRRGSRSRTGSVRNLPENYLSSPTSKSPARFPFRNISSSLRSANSSSTTAICSSGGVASSSTSPPSTTMRPTPSFLAASLSCSLRSRSNTNSSSAGGGGRVYTPEITTPFNRLQSTYGSAGDQRAHPECDSSVSLEAVPLPSSLAVDVPVPQLVSAVAVAGELSKENDEAHPELLSRQSNFMSKLKPLGFSKKQQQQQQLAAWEEQKYLDSCGDPSTSDLCLDKIQTPQRLGSDKRSFRRPVSNNDNAGVDSHQSLVSALLDATPKRHTSQRSSKSKKPILTKEEEERIFAEYNYTGATTNIHPLLSSLVNYTHPVKFSGFDIAESNDFHFHMSSFSESTGLGYLKQSAPEFVNYNKRQLSRIYPKGARVDSSNFLPQIFWNAGCQMVSLNFQTPDVCMQLNQGKFEYNGQCGYLLKPDFMRRPDRSFDPFSESPVDGVIAAHCSVRILSGHFLCERKVGVYVEVEMYGLPTDTIRKEHRTRTVPGNALNPIFNDDPFVFRKVVLPELAVLRFAVYDENGKQLGQRILPLDGLQAGYRHISLRTDSNMTLTLPTLFVHLVLKTYVPDELSGLVDALADPRAYVKNASAQEKRKEALHNMGVDDSDIVEITPAISGSGSGSKKRNESSLLRSQKQNGSATQITDGRSSGTHSGQSPVPPSIGKELKETSVAGSFVQKPSTDNLLNSAGSAAENKFKVENINIAELRKDKCFQKQLKKHLKDVEEMKKKHQKLRDAIQKHQQTSVDKLVVDNSKQASKRKNNNLATTSSNPSSSVHCTGNCNPATTARHPPLRGQASDPLQMPVNNSDAHHPSTPLSESEAGDKKIRDLVLNQTDEWSKLNRVHELEEFELRKKQIREDYDLLRKLLLEAQKAQMATLKMRFESENKELKQSQTKKSMDDTKIVQQDKGIKTKAERDRRVKELNEKNVKMFVEERKRLATKCRRHEEQLEKRHAEQSEGLDKETAKAIEMEEMNHREALLAASRPESIV